MFVFPRMFLRKILRNRMDMHLVLIFSRDVVVNELTAFFDHQSVEKSVDLNKINLFERLNQVHRDLLDHIEMLFSRQTFD